MKIVGRDSEVFDYYENMSIGDVFLKLENGIVYMHTDRGAANLEDGYVDDLDNFTLVRKLDVELLIK